MSKVNSFLSQRLKLATERLSKMTGLAEMSSNGQLSSFSGVFRVSSLSKKEQETLENILTQYGEEQQEIQDDLQSLSALTSELKAINNQAAILHGERIKKAQEILKKYRDGAFSAWLIVTYGNRQTPYNFLQYYELYTSIPQLLHPQLDEMPRQAVYALASRQGPIEKKEEIIKNYRGAPKDELLSLIRDSFPLEQSDKRAEDFAQQAIYLLKKVQKLHRHARFRPSEKQKIEISNLLNSFF